MSSQVAPAIYYAGDVLITEKKIFSSGNDSRFNHVTSQIDYILDMIFKIV